MRNMNVLLQEFGGAGRLDEKEAVGLLVVNQHTCRDDQHLGYWLDACDASDVARIKQEYQGCWKWIYSVYTGDCLRDGILNYYNEDSTSTSVDAEDCCLCCESAIPKDFVIQKQLLLLLNALSELAGAFQKNNVGIAKHKLISWLGGTKQDWLALDAVQNIIDQSTTYVQGVIWKAWTGQNLHGRLSYDRASS